MHYTLKINSIRGLAGSVVELDAETARQLAVNGIVDLQEPQEAPKHAVKRGPDVVKVQAPEIVKRRPGRPRKADASHADN